MSTRFRTMMAFGVVVVAASLLVAQDRPATQRNQKTRTGATAQVRDQATPHSDATGHRMGMGAALDKYVTACVSKENEGEIAIAKIAQQRSSNPQVKQFAEMLVKDHSAFLQKLQSARTTEEPAQGGQRRDIKSTPAQQDQSKGEAATSTTRLKRDRGTTAADQGDLAGRSHGIPVQTLISVNDEIHDRCLTSAKQELEQKEGADFDKCFLGMQVGAHMQMVDALEVLQNHVSSDLKQTLSEGADASKQHLAKAKELMAQLEGKASGERTTQEPSDINKTSRRREPQNK